MSKNTSKTVRRTVGASFLILAGVTGFYQYQYSQVKRDQMVNVVIATKDIKPSDELNDTNTMVVKRDKSNLSEKDIRNSASLSGSVATDHIYKNEDINSERIISAKKYKKLGYRLVSIQSKENADTFIGYSVKPGDKVDLLFYDKDNVYEGTPYLKGATIYDLRSSEGVSFSDRDSNFIASYGLFWVKEDVAEDINEKQQQGGYFKLQLHRDKSSIND